MNQFENYAWLRNEPGPKMLVFALSLIGTQEAIGPDDNPVILKWADECGLDKYTDDSIPWCGLFMAYVALKSGWSDHIPKDPLWARNWLKFGEPSPVPMLGDVLVFSRAGGGHVGIYVGQDLTHYHVLGGNQGDCVSIVRIVKRRLLGARHPRWRVAAPPNRRVIYLRSEGVISENEA